MSNFINSNFITFIDTTDAKKIDVHIASNYPTTQIYNTNRGTYTPNWSSVSPLTLTATVFADSVDVTHLSTFKWIEIKGDNTTGQTLSPKSKELNITSNMLSAATPLIRYRCEATYNGNPFYNEITFALINDGVSAPMVQAQYSSSGADGTWETNLDTSIHKYIHFSYDGGNSWTKAIKITGEDGKPGEDGRSVELKGVAYAKITPTTGQSIELFSDIDTNIQITSATDGDSYLVDGYLCVYNGVDFICTGQIQGPQGEKGDSYYLFIRYANDANGSGISISPEGKSYIGFCRSSVNQVPTDVSSATWNWAKFVGEDAKSIILTGNAQVFKVNKNNVISPSEIKVMAQAENTTVKTWSYNIDGGIAFSEEPPAGISQSGNIVTITGSAMTSNLITIKASDGVRSDIFTVYKVSDGSDGKVGADGKPAPIVFLTNENITFAANANGQVSSTSVTCNVVAYSGTTPVIPTTGDILSSDIPNGMTINKSTVSNQVQLTIDIASNANLGSAQNTNGVIGIPITSPVSTTLQLTWSKINSGAKGDKGDTGAGIKSTTVSYGVSDSASTQPSSSAWQSTIPTVAEGKYLWTRTIIDYTDDTVPDTVTYTYAKQGVKGDAGSSGSSVTVKSIRYQAGTSATDAPTGTWSDSVVAVAEGNYLWTQTTFSDNKVAYGVAKQGQKGDQGVQGPKGNDAYTVMLTNESHIFAGDVSNAIAGTAETQVLAYNGSTAQAVTITSVNGKTAATSDTDTGIAGLKFKCSALSGASPTITFTCTTSFVSPSGTIPIVLKVDGVTITKMFTYSIAFKGATGAQGSTGTAASLVDITPSALYFKSTTGKDGTFTPDYIYLYPRFQTVTYSKWEYSVDGGTTWVAASGANGLTIGTYNSVANTLRIAKASTLYTDTVTSISFRCVSSTSTVYDTISIAKIYDVVNLEIGGRNLLQRTNNTQKTSSINTNKYGVIGQFVPSTQSWKNGYVDISEYGLSIGDTLTFQAYLIPQNEMPVAVRAWGSDNGTSGSPLKDGNYLSEPGVSSCTFTMTHPYIYLGIAVQNTITESITEKYSSCKLERGNKATDWSPAPEDMISTTFQLYAPKGSLITKDIPEVTLETFAYDGSQPISGATFVWYSWINDAWEIISGATGASLTLNKSSVLKSNVYKCEMAYKGKVYESTATVEDKTDIYESIMCVSSNARGNNCYWVLYTLVYTDAEEVDSLLGPISINAPDSPVSGDYWYAVDEANASVQLKKYNGTTWANSTDTQSLSYYWDIVNNGSEKVAFGDHSKVQVVSCNDFTSTATLVCGVNNAEDGLLTQSSLSLTDASDPIVSTTEPTNIVDGQLWIKPNNNGTYIMSIWDATNNMWVVNDMDTRTKVHTSKPSTYNVGDLWITASDTEHGSYLEGTLLMANTTSSTFNESHWSTTLKYDKDLDSIKETLNDLSQYVNITSEGLKIGAQSASGEISPFTSLFTSTELAFYQNSDKLLTLSNNQLTAPHIVIEDDLEVGKTISLGNLNLTIETNGSFSFAVTK